MRLITVANRYEVRFDQSIVTVLDLNEFVFDEEASTNVNITLPYLMM